MTASTPRTAIAVLALALAALLGLASPAAAEFQIESFDGSTLDSGGVTYTQAGGRPDTVSTSFIFTKTTTAEGKPAPAGQVKDIFIELPPGLIGDPTAVPRCRQTDFAAGLAGNCPKASQVGTSQLLFNYNVNTGQYSGATRPVFSLVPPPGVAALFGFRFLTATITIAAQIRTGDDYGVTLSLHDTSQVLGLFANTTTFWGVPASHNEGGWTPTPFISLPTSCQGPQTTAMRADSWQNPGVFEVASFVSHDTLGEPVGTTGCDLLSFDPSITVRTDTAAADSPTGLDVELTVPQNESANVPAQAQLKDAAVTLPEGIALNPSSANGLGSCTPAQADLDGPDPVACPDASKVGSVEIKSPLLDDPLTGGVYLATPHQNPFGSLVAIYVSAVDPRSGTVIKLPGRVDLDPQSGRLTTTFEENPQLPFESFKLHFFGGRRASLVTPQSCGTFTATAALTPWSENGDVNRSDSFEIDSGPGGACASGAGAPNRPAFQAGAKNSVGGVHSPFILDLSRADGSQQLGTIKATLPPGLLARLAGIPYCPDAALAAAGARSGAAERANPSCPAASRVGKVTTGSGAGPEPYYVEGDAYLAGPYRGAPLSLAFVTPVVAGPFDLGTVVVRSAMHVDPHTTQVTTVSDPLPTILDGIPLNLRSVAIDLDRSEFTLNPTSCEEMSVAGESVSVLGQAAPVATRFQVVACERLGFKPKLAMRFIGKASRSSYPRLRATVTMPKDGANIAKTTVVMPKTELLENAHIRTICTRDQWAADSCPKGSIYGKAKAWTPLLDKPLEGNVYLRSNGGARQLPDLVADLRGQIDLELVGYIDAVNARLRARFLNVPDAPVSKFILDMQGGKKGLLVHNTNVCRTKPVASAKFDGQNGKVHDFNPVVKVACGKKK